MFPFDSKHSLFDNSLTFSQEAARAQARMSNENPTRKIYRVVGLNENRNIT
jgi:hypothetical protein